MVWPEEAKGDSSVGAVALGELWTLGTAAVPNFAARCAAYQFYRAQGWVVRPGEDFAADFR